MIDDNERTALQVAARLGVPMVFTPKDEEAHIAMRYYLAHQSMRYDRLGGSRIKDYDYICDVCERRLGDHYSVSLECDLS